MQQQPPQGQQLADGRDQLPFNPAIPPPPGQHNPSPVRLPGDPRHSRTALAVPTGPAGHPSKGPNPGPGIYELARSPPNAANKAGTKHVPCKFFRQGACQAGPACPFLHSLDASVDSAPCKYFAKGNCKFGAKCALAHILPDGRRVNRHNMPTPMPLPGSGGFLPGVQGANQAPFQRPDATAAAAMASPLPAQQPVTAPTPPSNRPLYPYPGGQDPNSLSYQQQQQQQQQHRQFPQQVPGAPQLSSTPKYTDIPIIDHSFTDSGLKFGSPADDPRQAMSSLIGRTALDAPLPASFDSQGVSYLARNGPIAASVPSTFGLDVASPSVLSRHLQPSNDVLRGWNDPVFGKSPSNIASSPLDASVRQSYLQRIAKPQMISASVPRPSALSSQLDEWDDNFAMEEDYLPMSLHDDVLTPQERMRRLSRTEQDNSHRGELSSLNVFGGSSSAPKVGSPLASSPSRFGALFAKQRQRKEEEALSASLGHIGSPRRDFSLTSRSNLIVGSPLSSNGDPFSGIRPSGVSAITEQLGRTSLHPHAARSSAATKLDRVMTSSPHSATIDEENENDLVFSMEEEDHKDSDSHGNSGSWHEGQGGTSNSHAKEGGISP